MKTTLDLMSLRARKARAGRRIGRHGYLLLLSLLVICILLGSWLGLWATDRHYVFLLATAAIICYMLASWWKRDLSIVPVSGKSLNGSLSVDILSRLESGVALSPRSLWEALATHWQTIFFSNHLLLPNKVVSDNLSTEPADLVVVWQRASELAQQNGDSTIEVGYVAAALLLGSDNIRHIVTQLKLQPGDIEELASWLSRGLESMRRSKQNFGGIARDWSFGFTPLLDHYGDNISLAIAKYGAHFGWLVGSPGVNAVEAAFNNQAGAIALVGPVGVGKTSHVYALAQKLIEGRAGPALAYHQIIGLDAGLLVSNARGPGDLEQLINRLANEAVQAGHIILFLDNAELFFGNGLGSFDASNILLPIIQSRRLPIIMALNPTDYQRLRANAPNLAGLITPIILQEPPEASVMSILEDTAIKLENQHNVLVAFEALREAYRLSGRYDQEEAYPGKAIKLLEQGVNHTDHEVVTAHSIQLAIEQTRGVKVGAAAPAEADDLLHLEDKIHQRMINQSRAVQVVASALRRSRAGIANPRRPIGSFLFLGPTGVGKTELAKAVAAEYFAQEANLIRLDMSEYQQSADVKRLLATGQNEAHSLLMSVRQQPFSVVLLDEIEKAHPNILNLLLQLLDEGQLTDESGRGTSFRDCIIIATSNAGADLIRQRIAAGESLESFEDAFVDQLISSGQFKPELLNRFDEIVLFRPLKPEELAQIVQLMMVAVNATLSNQNITVNLTSQAIDKIVEAGYDPRLGARPMRRTLQRAVEDTVARKILAGQISAGDSLLLDVNDLDLSNR